MTTKIQSMTDNFDVAAADKKFVYLRKNAQVTIESSADSDFSVCKTALRILDALDYGAGPAAQNLMANFIQEAEKKTPPLPLGITLETNYPTAPTVPAFEIIPAPATPQKPLCAQKLTDDDVSREYGGTQYAQSLRQGPGRALGIS